MTDPAALWASRYEIRRSAVAIARLRTVDLEVADLLDRLDAICTDLTARLAAMEPQLPVQEALIAAVEVEPVRRVVIVGDRAP